MDPYSAEGELINIHNHFHQGQYDEVISFDITSLSPENTLPARVLQLRARVALGQAAEALADVQGATEPELQAVGALAELALGNVDAAVSAVEQLAAAAESSADNATVQVLGGTVLQAAGKPEEALALLGRHQGSCGFSSSSFGFPPCKRGVVNTKADWRGCCGIVDAVALIVQIHLHQNRNDLAVKEVAAARRWAQDSLLVNLAESWVGLRLVSYNQILYQFF
jgi:coatomer protein complex subunit epsilon